MTRFEASWPITPDGVDMPKCELEAEARPDLADMLHAAGVQATADPVYRIAYRPHPELHAVVPVEAWTDPVRRRKTPTPEGTAA